MVPGVRCKACDVSLTAGSDPELCGECLIVAHELNADLIEESKEQEEDEVLG